MCYLPASFGANLPMSVLAIIVALLLEQWRPVDERRALHEALARGVAALERSLEGGASQGMLTWLLAVVPACVLAVALHGLLSAWSGLFGFLFDVSYNFV